MQLQATLDVIAIVLVLLIIILATWVTLSKQYTKLKKMDNKLDSLIQQFKDNIGDSDDTDS